MIDILVMSAFLVFVVGMGGVARLVEEDQEANANLRWMLWEYKE